MYFLIFIGIIVLDQITKQFISMSVNYNYEIEVIKDFFYITNVRNKGVAWGILQNHRIFIIMITMGVILCMLYFLHKTKERYTKIIYIFIISGALGNFIDRLFRGYVIDFLDFYIGFYHFPTFNVADIFITIGTFMLVCEFFKGKKENYE